VHKAKELPREQFKREVERHLTGKETEAWEICISRSTKVSCWESPRISRFDARHRQVSRVLPRNDLRRFSRGSRLRSAAKEMTLLSAAQFLVNFCSERIGKKLQEDRGETAPINTAIEVLIG
jgi:hypothetical protein